MKLGFVWRNRKKISQIINDYLYLPFFILIILRCRYQRICTYRAAQRSLRLKALLSNRMRSRRARRDMTGVNSSSMTARPANPISTWPTSRLPTSEAAMTWGQFSVRGSNMAFIKKVLKNRNLMSTYLCRCVSSKRLCYHLSVCKFCYFLLFYHLTYSNLS